MKKWLLRILFVLLVILVVIQFVPYGRSHTNPPVTGEPSWDSPRTKELAQRLCFDCHSNETRWPWYASVAPVSWLVQHDVDEGREHLNFSEWDKPQKHADDAAEEYAEGEMPPAMYVAGHCEVRLAKEDRQALIQGLRATFGGEDEHGHDESEGQAEGD